MSSLRAKLDRRRGIADKPSRKWESDEEEEKVEYDDDDDDDDELIIENDHDAVAAAGGDGSASAQPQEQQEEQQQEQQQQQRQPEVQQSDSEVHLEDDPEDLLVEEDDDDDDPEASSGNDDALKKKNNARQQKRKPAPVKKKAPPPNVEYDDEPSSSDEEVNEDPKDDEDYHESSGDDDNDDDDSDDEDFGTTKRKAPARKKKAPARSRATAAKKKKGPPPPRNATRKRARVQKDTSSEEELDVDVDEEDSDEIVTSSRRRGRNTAGRRVSPRKRRATTRSAYRDVGSSGGEEEESDNDDSDASVARKRTPSRASAAKATAKIAQINYKEDQSDSEEDEDPVPATRKRKKDSDDEEYQVDEKKELEFDDDQLDEDMNSDESFAQPNNRAVGNADNIDFGEDDISDYDDDDDGKGNSGKPRALQKRAVGRSRRAATKEKAEQYYSDSDDNDDADEISPTKAGRKAKERTSRNKSKSGPPKLPPCPSEVDEITNDPLPERHVCFIAPDGKSRQCFALETLHKIANMTSHPQYRENLSGQQQRTFLQPPHFRSAMSGDLLDQIASRFGRQALDLDGEFYKRDSEPAKVPAADGEDDLYQVNFQGTLADEDEFLDTWRDYQLRTMGSQDVYVCPLCYTVAHHRLTSPDRNEEIVPPSEFKYDPMTVLGYPDDNDFEIASAFCFKKITEVRQHLKEDHNVDSYVVGDSGLWYKFKVRTQDGLLQRFLSKSRKYGKTKQGDMRRYWYDGNSEVFIYLLYQMERLRIYRNLLKEQGDDGSDEEDDDEMDPLRGAKDFIRSFGNQATDLWESLVSPYSKKAQDMSDFIAGNDEEVEGEGEEGPRHVFNQEEAAAEQDKDEALAKYYENREKQRSDGEESSNYEEEEELDDKQYQQQLSSESEEDDWVKGIRNKHRKKSLEPNARVNGKTTNGSALKKLGGRKKDDSDSDASAELGNGNMHSSKNPPSAAKRAVLEDSD